MSKRILGIIIVLIAYIMSVAVSRNLLLAMLYKDEGSYNSLTKDFILANYHIIAIFEEDREIIALSNESTDEEPVDFVVLPQNGCTIYVDNNILDTLFLEGRFDENQIEVHSSSVKFILVSDKNRMRLYSFPPEKKYWKTLREGVQELRI